MKNYKLLYGDVLKKLSKLKDNSIDLCITDPPYGVLANGMVAHQEAKNYKKNEWDIFSSDETFEKFTKDWFSLLYQKMKPDSFIFVFWSQKRLQQGLEIFNPNRVLIWHYTNLLMSANKISYDYDPIFLIYKGRPKMSNFTHSVLSFTKPQNNFKSDQAIYPTQKPRELIKHLLKSVNLPAGSTVLDCFQGSGVVGEQSLLNNYKYIGIDNSKDSIIISTKLLNNVLLSK